MNSSLFTPRRILAGIAILAALFLLRECLKNRTAAGEVPGQVNIRYDAAATNLNPYLTSKGSDIYTCARVFSTFAEMDPKTMELLPAIIKEIPSVRTVSAGPRKGQLAYDFEILPEVVWDNGTPVTGRDVAFTLKIIFHPLIPAKAFQSYFKDLCGIDIDQQNPQKFTLYLKNYYFLALEAMCQSPIMPAYHYDPSNRMGNIPVADFLDSTKLAAFKTEPGMVAFAEEYQQPKYANDPKSVVGSGPYQLEVMNEQGVVLVKKQKYWGDAMAEQRPIVAAYPKKLVYKVVLDENVVENMLNIGELDVVAGSLSAGKFLEMKQKDSLAAKYHFDILPSSRYSRWFFNLQKPNLQDVRVRKALAHIVDYDHFINNIQSGLAVRIVSPILPTKRYYAKDMPMYDFNIQKARDLLADAGWSDSDQDGIVDKVVNGKKVNLTIEVFVPINNTSKKYGESITETGRLAGIQIQAVNLDLSEIDKKSSIGDYESAFLGANIFMGLSDLSQRFHSKNLAPNGSNRSRYINPSLDAVLDSISSEKNDARRDQLYLKAQKILHDDVPEVFLLSPAQTIITAKKFDAVITSNRPCYIEQLFKLKKG